MIGKRINQFGIIAKLGEGGMGEVYLAADANSGQRVAIKFLSLERNADAEARRRFLHETKAQEMLSHANLTAFVDAGEFEGRAYIVMEYVDGRPLDAYVAENKPRTSEMLDLLRQVAEGLASAHERGVIHRDIKPQNILVTAQGHVKITDFGLARWKTATTLTQTGTQMGTAYYMSPEQIEGRKVDHRSDLFSLGVIAYELICGKKPFEGESTAEVTYKTTWETPHPMARYAANIPDELQRITDKCLDKNPTKRYQAATELGRDFAKVAGQIERGEVMVSHGPQARRRRLLRRGAVALALAMIVVASGIGLKYVGIQIEPTQEVGAAIPSLAVVMFNNVVDPVDSSRTAQMAASLLTSGLSESRFLRVTSRQRVLEILGSMGKGELRELDRATARELAQRAGVRWMVTGEVMQTSPRLVVSTEVTEIQSGEIATSQTVTGTPGEDLFSLVDRMSQALRSGLPLQDSARIESLPRVADVTTSSHEAYKYYLEGLDYNHKFYFQDAKACFLRAVEADSTFAMAHYELSRVSPPELMERAIKRAMQFAHRASWREQRLIKSRGYRFVYRPDSAMIEARALVERFPNDKEGHYVMSVLWMEFRNPDSLLKHGKRLVEIDSLDPAGWRMLGYAYHVMGAFDSVLSASTKYIEMSPKDAAEPYLARGNVYIEYGHPEEAIQWYMRALEVRPGWYLARWDLGIAHMFNQNYAAADSLFQLLAGDADREIRSLGRAQLALLPLYQGKFSIALETIDRGLDADKMEGYSGIWERRKHEIRVSVLRAQGRFKEALAELGVVQKVERERFPPYLVNFRDSEVELCLEAGDTARAHAVASALQADALAKDAVKCYVCDEVSALIASAEGRYDEVLSLTDRIPWKWQPVRQRNLRANAYIEKKEFKAAIEYINKANLRVDEASPYDPVRYVLFIYLTAVAYEGAGDIESAIGKYQTFLSIWKDADPGIPEIVDARQRLARLEGE